MQRNQLGYITKFPGQNASVVGIFNYQGANEEYGKLIDIATANRLEFYDKIRDKITDKNEL